MACSDGVYFLLPPTALMERTPLIAPPQRLNSFQYAMVMFSLYFGVYLAALDGTVVSTLLSHIASDLNALSDISWVATSYLVSYSAFQPLYGKISDIFGRKSVLIFCNSVFALGCLICGVSSSLGPLVLGRFVSGIGAGGLLSLSTIAVSDYVPLRKRGIYQGINNIAFGVGSATGGIFGALATDWGGWRLAFTLQVPLCMIGIVTLWLFLSDKPVLPDAVVETDVSVLDEEMSIDIRTRRTKSRSRRPSQPIHRNSLERIDFMGAITLVISLTSFMLGINMGGNEYAWASVPIISAFVLALVSLAVFVYWELYRAREPLLPIRILMHRTIISACFTNFFAVGANYAFLFYSPVFLTAAYDFSYSKIAHRLIANFVGVAAGSLSAGFYMARTGRYYALGVVATSTMAIGALLFGIMPWLSDELAASTLYTSLAYLAFGMGYTATLTVCLTALISAVPSKFQAMTTSAQYTFRGVGSSLGTALAASIFSNTLNDQLELHVTGPKAQKIIEKVRENVETIRTIPKQYIDSVVWSYKMAGVAVFGFCVAMLVLATVSSGFQQQHAIDDEHEEMQDFVSSH